MLQGGFWTDKDGVSRWWLGGKRFRRSGGGIMRSPRTTQEIRANDNYKKWVDGFWVRGRRRHLPTTYDDLIRHFEKCWKRNRGTQWK